MARRGTTRAFLASVNAWTLATEQRSEAAFREGSIDFYDALRDATPVLTGNLRNSLVATTNGETTIVTGPGNDPSDGNFRSGANTSRANIMSAKIGDKISYMYTATYFRRLENGFSGYDSLGRFYSQAGRFFAARVGARYRSIMRNSATKLRLKMK